MLALIELWLIYLFWPVILAAFGVFWLLAMLGGLAQKLQGMEPKPCPPLPTGGKDPWWYWLVHGGVIAICLGLSALMIGH